MIGRQVERLIEKIPYLDEVSDVATTLLKEAIAAGGEPARDLEDLLHGTWLGHPLHPVLTDVPIGAWLSSSLFDLLSLGDERARYAADGLTALGVVSALPTILAGLADYARIPGHAKKSTTLHALMMDGTTTLYAISLLERGRGNRERAMLLSALGATFLSAGAYLGGHISFRERVGVNHARTVESIEEWRTALPEAELAEHESTRVSVDGKPVLLYRYGGTVYAMGAVCSHAGGPLEEGERDGFCIRCPWHDSVFDSRDGSVVHGPATYAQPEYDARIMDGMIEVRSATG